MNDREQYKILEDQRLSNIKVIDDEIKELQERIDVLKTIKETLFERV